jgi:toxin ParE1/3/4
VATIQKTARAEEDLIEIWLYIAPDNVEAADLVLDEIEMRFHALAEHPSMGRMRLDIAPELRYFPVGNYLILYRTITSGVEIVRVLHGSRDIPNLF